MPHLELSTLTLLLAQIAAILLLSRVLGVITRWLGQPMVIAEILAGILLGPSVLGWVWPDALAALFPGASMPVLKMLSQIGLVLFMFLIGLELDPRLLKGRTHSSVAISHTSIILPFALGAGAAWWLRDDYSSVNVSFTAFQLFLGTAMSVTAFPVLARILSERHLLTTRMGTIAIACAAVDDLTAWCLLAFVVSVARAHGIAEALWTTGFAVAFVLTMLLLIRPFVHRLGARVVNREGLNANTAAIVLLLLLVSSAATEIIGIHALFGAFLFGAILPKEGRLAETLVDKLEIPATVLLLPIFFAYSGLRTEIGLVNQPREWFVAGVLILLATLGKFGGSAVAARLTGLRWREASAIGILMNTRGLMELVVLNIGLDLGVISPTIFTMMVVMALVTTFATTPALRWVYPDKELVRDRKVEAAPTGPAAPTPYTVLMCVPDGSDEPGLATVSAALLGTRATPARLFALHLWNPSERPSVDLRREQGVADDESPMAALLRRADSLTLDVRPLGFVSTDPAVDICRTAEAKQASLILLGSHRPLLLEGRLGGTVADVIARAQSQVGVLLDRGLQGISRILVAYAGGPEDLAALRLARQMAETPGVELTMLHVVGRGRAEHPGDGRRQVDQVFADPDLPESTFRLLVVEHESPPQAVLDECSNGYDLVILGVHSRWGLEAGAISLRRQRVLTECLVSVLAVHAPASAQNVRTEESAYFGRLAESPSG